MSAVPRLVSLAVLVTLIVVLGVSFFKVVAPFLLPLFLAAVVAMISQPLFRYFQKKLRGHVRLAAGVTTVALVAAVLVPVSLGIFIASVQVYTITQTALDSGQLDRWVTQIRKRLDRDALFRQVQPFLPVDASVQDPEKRRALQREQFERYLEQWQQDLSAQLRGLARMLAALATQTVGTTVSLVGAIAAQLIALVIFLIALYYFLADGPKLLEAAEAMIPVHVEYQRELAGEFAKAVRAVIVATFAAAIAQGAVTSLLLWVIGRAIDQPALCHVVLFWLLATLAALIPLAGTSLVWVPCAVWLVFIGHWGAALVLSLLAATVVGTLDNLIRVFVLKNDAQLHPLLAFVSVLGGLRVLGVWGVFVGPIIACTLHGLVKIFNEELREFSRERFFILSGPDSPSAPDERFRQAYRASSASSVEGLAPTSDCSTVPVTSTTSTVPAPSKPVGRATAAATTAAPAASETGSSAPEAAPPVPSKGSAKTRPAEDEVPEKDTKAKRSDRRRGEKGNSY